jgi:hypothetical protein
VVAAVRIDAGACANFLQRFAEAITVAVGDADLVLVAQFVLVDAGDMAAFDEVRHAADHIPGAHEALQVDRRIRAAARGVLARGDGGSLAAMAGPPGTGPAARRRTGGSKSCGSGLSGLAAHGRLCVRDPSMVSQPVRRGLPKLCCIVHRRSPMNARSVRRPATERVIERADPRLLRSVQQVALAGLALVLVWPAARGSSAWLGWLPMWLVGMPLVAWWALLRFPLPRLSWLRLARRTGGQARRRRRRAPSPPATATA